MASTTWTSDPLLGGLVESLAPPDRTIRAPALMIVAGAIFKWPEFFLQMGEDQGMFNYGGLLLLQGGQLYRDLWEAKPPADYLLHGLAVGVIDHPWDKLWIGHGQWLPTTRNRRR